MENLQKGHQSCGYDSIMRFEITGLIDHFLSHHLRNCILSLTFILFTLVHIDKAAMSQPATLAARSNYTSLLTGQCAHSPMGVNVYVRPFTGFHEKEAGSVGISVSRLMVDFQQ